MLTGRKNIFRLSANMTIYAHSRETPTLIALTEMNDPTLNTTPDIIQFSLFHTLHNISV